MEKDETLIGWTSLVLLERFRDGDDQAAEALFSRYVRTTDLAGTKPALASPGGPDRSGRHRDVGLSKFFRRSASGPVRIEARRGPLAITGVDHQAQVAPTGPTSTCGLPVSGHRIAARSGRRRTDSGSATGTHSRRCPRAGRRAGTSLLTTESLGTTRAGATAARSRALGNRGGHGAFGTHRPTHPGSDTRTSGRTTRRCLTTISNREF